GVLCGDGLDGGHHAVRCPGGQADAAAGTAAPEQLGGRAGLVGGEDDAERGQDDVEGGVGERQVLGVGLPGFQFQALDLGAAGGGFPGRGDEVGGGFAGSPAGG